MKMKLFTVFAAWSATFIATAQAPTGPAVKSATPPSTSLAAPVAAAKASAAALSDQAKATDATLAAPKVAEAPVPKAVTPSADKAAEKKEAVQTTESLVPAANPIGQADEIDLEEVDDTAVSAQKQATVKTVSPELKADDKVPSKRENAPETQTADKPMPRATGSEIAAKYLSGNEGALVDITSDEATLTDILRQFRKATGANIIYAESSNLQQRVSVNLKRVPWLQAMSSILSSRGFRVESSSGIHFVKEDKLAIPVHTRTFQLKHASADELAKLFNESYGEKAKDGKLLKGVATPFQGANSVVVTANERTLADCEAIIKSVDKAVPQIYIEARFVELSNQAKHQLGVQWNQLESWSATARDISAGWEYNNGRVATYPYQYGTKTKSNTFASENSLSSSSGNSSSATSLMDGFNRNAAFFRDEKNNLELAPVTAAKLPGDMSWRNARGFSGQLSAEDFRLAMSAFEQMEDVKIFSNPKIIVSNGKEAFFDRTTKFPNIAITSQHEAESGYTKSDAKLEVIPGEDKLFSKTAFFSWGITLSVKPRISPDGLISVEIVPSISELDKTVSQTGFFQINGGTDLPYGSYPIILFKRITTDFTMKDGCTAVIGGLSQTEEADVDSGIPYLRQIPWIGQKFFGWKSRAQVQKEIIVFVTVGIADPADLPEDMGLPKNAVRGREYIQKRAFEPGDRKNGVVDVLKMDMRTLDERIGEMEKKSSSAAKSERGTVTITPVLDDIMVKEIK